MTNVMWKIVLLVMMTCGHCASKQRRSDYITDDSIPNDELKELPYWKIPQEMEKILYAEPAGNRVQFKCKAGGSPPITTEWFREKTTDDNGKGPKELLTKDKRRVGGFKFRHQTLQLDTVVPSDNGFYSCVVSNKYGSINHTYELDVAADEFDLCDVSGNDAMEGQAHEVIQDKLDQTEMEIRRLKIALAVKKNYARDLEKMFIIVNK